MVASNNLVGPSSAPDIFTGGNNVILGFGNALDLQFGNGNVCLGSQNSTLLNIGSKNVSIGQLSLCSNTSGSDNIAVGSNSGLNFSGSDNIAIGSNSGGIASASNQIAIGKGALCMKANECVFGDATLTCVRSGGVGTCDLGSIARPFKHIYGKIVNAPSPGVSTSMGSFDFSTMTPSDLLAPITATGGTNVCHGGIIQSYIASTDLLVGRIVSFANGTSNQQILTVRYAATGDEQTQSTTPIGVTMHNCVAGQVINICTYGIVSIITANAATIAARGTAVICSGVDGRVSINTAQSTQQIRVGALMTNGNVPTNSAVLVWLNLWYQGY